MNVEKVGIRLAKICDKENKDFDDLFVYVEPDKDKVSNIFYEIVIPENQKNVKMQHLPYKTQDKTYRQVLYITGQAGSGKSYYCMMYIKEYQKLFPNNKVYIFSSLKSDDTIDQVKNLQRVKLDEKFYNTPFTTESFRDCLIVFDDHETIKNPLLREKIKNILDLILENGRHENTFVIVTSHVATNRERTKLILAEAHSITLFLATIGENTLDYVLRGYFGLSKEQIEKIVGLGSRWITVIKSYPMIVLYEKGMYVLNKKRKEKKE